jgi:hypothetical protein
MRILITVNSGGMTSDDSHGSVSVRNGFRGNIGEENVCKRAASALKAENDQ